MAITTMDGIVAALSAAQDQKIFFPSATNVAGGWVNLSQAVTGGNGIMAVPGTAAAGGTTYNQSTVGAGFPKWSAAVGGATTYIGRVGLTMATAGAVHIYDLCWACSGFVGNLATAQTVTGFTGLPARHSSGVGLEIWVGCSTAIGATAHNVTVQYTNQAGTAGRNTVSTAGITSMPANRMYQLPLQSGDTGVQSIQGITLSASSGTAGNLWVLVLERYVGAGSAIPNVPQVFDFAQLGMPTPSDEACLLFVNQGTATSSGIILGQLDIIQG